jgi:N-acyl-L-homoserine lactone synthetase
MSNEYDVSTDEVESSRHFLPPRSSTMTQQEVQIATATAVINTSMQLSIMSYITLVIIV